MNDKKADETVNCMDRFTSIVADGLYEYLKANGLLKKNESRQEKIKKVIEDNKQILSDHKIYPVDIY